MGRRQTPIARWSIHATGVAGSSRVPTSRISLSSRLMTMPFCIRRRCSRAPFLLRGVSPRDRRTAEQRDEQQPPGWSGVEPSTGCLPNCVTAVFAFLGGLFSLVDDSRTGYPPRALFCADVPTSWWTTPFVNLTVADIPTGAEFDVDVQ